MPLGSDLHGRSEGVFIGVTTTFALASVFVTARLVTRFAITKAPGWDDYFILLAWVSKCSTSDCE